MGDCKRITATAKEMVVNVRDGAKTAVSTSKEISTKLKTVSLATDVPIKCFEVELKGLGESHISEPSLFRYNGDNTQASEVFSKLFEKPVAELSSATDMVASTFQTPKQDTFAASDSVTFLADFRPIIQDVECLSSKLYLRLL